MTYKDAMEWFKVRKPPMPGAREAFEMAAVALGCMSVLEDNSLMGELISKDAVLKSCKRYGSEPMGEAQYSFSALCIKEEVLMLPSVKMQKGDNAG